MNLLRNLKLAFKEPSETVFSCGGIIGQHTIYEQIKPKGRTDLSYAVAKKGKTVSYLSELETDSFVYQPFEKVPWTMPEDILDYDDEQLWKELKECVTTHLDFQDDSAYDILVVWILATWQLWKWRSVPYLFFYGPLESGKTRSLELLSQLCMRGWLALYTTPANLYRPLEIWHPTVFLDEAEIYGDKKEIIALLNGSYRRGQLVARQVESAEGFKTVFFDCFGFKALAGTKSLAKTLASRCITFKMSKATRPIELFVDEEWTRKLRKKLLKYRFDRFLREDSDDSADFLGRARTLGKRIGSGRLTELFFPLHEVAVTSKLKEQTIKHAIEIGVLRLEELALTDEVVTFSAILEAFNSDLCMKGLILISKITDIINRNLSINEQWPNRRVSRICGRIGFQKIRTREGTAIKWNPRLIKRLKGDLRYKTCFEDTPLSGESALTTLSSQREQKRK